MDDIVDVVGRKDGLKRGAIAHVSLIEREPGRSLLFGDFAYAIEDLLARVREVVHNHDPVAPLEEFDDGVTSDEARPASDQYAAVGRGLLLAHSSSVR